MKTLLPSDASSSSLYVKENKLRHLLFTAETHSFPTGMNTFELTGKYVVLQSLIKAYLLLLTN